MFLKACAIPCRATPGSLVYSWVEFRCLSWEIIKIPHKVSLKDFPWRTINAVVCVEFDEKPFYARSIPERVTFEV